MKDFWKEQKKQINKKKIFLIILLLIILIALATTAILYIRVETIRDWINKNVLRKEVLQEKAVYIDLDDENSQVYAFSQYIGVLSNNEFDIYNSSGNKETTLNVELSNPIFDANNRFIAIAEKGGQRAYLITNKNIEWEKKVEGNISQISVNKNGYVAITISNTVYKTVIEVYDPEGELIFKTFLSSTRAADISMSNDNKYLAIAEVDTSGTMLQSTVKVVSIEKAQEDSNNSVENTYKAETNRLITNLNYQDKNKLLCMYTDAISIIDNGTEEFISENNNKKITFSSIELTNNSITLEEKSSGLFTADSILRISNSSTRESKEYVVKEVIKDIYARENVIALNLGTELEFVNTDAWLLKKYIANQEITNVVVSNELAGIVYRNKVEIVKL